MDRMCNRVTGSPGLALTRPPGPRAEEGGALRWRTLSVLRDEKFRVKQNFAPRYSDAARDVDARLHGSRGEGGPGENPPPRWDRKTGAPEDRGGRKTASPEVFGARRSNRPVSEIRIIRVEKVAESGHLARLAHAAGRRENVDIYSRRSVQNVNIYSLRRG